MLALVCAQRGDSEREADGLLAKMLVFRMFADAQGRMNLSLVDVAGGLLLVPQFTLAAEFDERHAAELHGPAAPPEDGERLFAYFVAQARARHPDVGAGIFGAAMQVELTNDGPVTFCCRSKRRN